MREIKFRAIRLYPKVEVYYFTLNDLIYHRFNTQVLIDYPGIKKDLFTGLRDKNGKEIYEGDICAWNGWAVESSKAAKSPLRKNFVVWSDKQGAWVWDNNETWNMAIYSNVEVIGNIYQNQELLK